MSDYRVDIKVRNNVFLYRLEQAGYSSIGELCRLNDKMNYASRIGEIVNMTRSPFNADGDWCKQLKWASDVLGCAPEDLFTDVQLNTVLKTNKKQIQINEAELNFMLEQHSSASLSLEDMTHKDQFMGVLNKTLDTLVPRERKVLEMRYGLGDYSEAHTLEQCSKKFGVNRERIRQIEARALRKLRHPQRHHQLLPFAKEGLSGN